MLAGECQKWSAWISKILGTQVKTLTIYLQEEKHLSKSEDKSDYECSP